MWAKQRPVVRAALRAVVVGLGALAIVASAGSPAAAHNELIATTPEDGAVLQTAPAAVELEFTEQVDERFARVAVTDRSGKVIASAPPRVAGTKVIQPLSLPAPGRYRVGFRVVSTDGHPVEDSITFTVRAVPSEAGSATPTATPAGNVGAGERSGTGGSAGWTPVAGLFGVLVLAAAGWIVVTRRRPLAEERGDGDASG
ncbi:MAG: copper resistance CopC family protein [Natronosporangium sp.]